MASNFPDDMDDLSFYKRAMKIIKPIDAIEACLAKFSKNCAIKFSRKMTSFATRKPKDTYRKVTDNILVTEEKFNNVSVRLYRPQNLNENEKSSAIVFIHGGYWFIYDVEDYDQLLYTLANRTRSLVASIEYTRTPEARYPVAFNEIYSSTRHLIENADLFKIDKNRVAIAGDSTGGIMAAALVHKLRRENVDLRLSCLINAPLQFIDLTLPSYQQNEKANHLNILSYEGVSRILHEYLGLLIPLTSLHNNSHVSSKMKEILSAKNLLPRNLLPEKYTSIYKDISVSNDKTAIPDDSLIFDENISPLLASDDILKLCPQTYIVTSEYDIFRDDGYLYEARLKQLGVNVNLKNYEHGYHGPLNLYQNQECKLPKTLFEDLVKYIIDNL